MPRRTKLEAQATRSQLLDAAELEFQANGVSGTSLADIAARAGTTRGAIYWHFKDKADLFNAMIERVALPLEHAMGTAAAPETQDPLAALREALFHAFDKTVTDPQIQRVFEVATHKVEYVDSLCAVRARHIAVRDECIAILRKVLQRAARLRGQKLPVTAESAARGLHALVDGLIQNWLLEPGAFDLRATGRQAVDNYLRGLSL
ncbi:MAG TPA: TetR family transcriptional regulator [Ramlibacter sp.]|nr:TetR family transcriptional regulator [Ramlibacter sp.]